MGLYRGNGKEDGLLLRIFMRGSGCSCLGASGFVTCEAEKNGGEVPKIRGTFVGVPRIRIRQFWDLY